jgi:hypothetical protein
MTMDSMIRKVRALLSRTVENGATEAEAAEALAKAQALMDQHGIEAGQLGRDQAGSSAYVWRKAWSGKRVPWCYPFAVQVVEKVCMVRAVLVRPSKADVRVMVLGDPIATEVAEWLTGHLIATYEGLWARYRVKFGATFGQSADYFLGLTVGILGRLDMQRAERLELDNVGGGVLARRIEGLEAEYDQEIPRASRQVVRRNARADSDVASDGVEDSRQVSLNRSVDQGTRQSIES